MRRSVSAWASGVFAENYAITFTLKERIDKVNWQLIPSPLMLKNSRITRYFNNLFFN
jgi:hypothetical protein